MPASAVDLLFVRRTDIVRLFLRRLNIKPATTRDQLRAQVEEHVTTSGTTVLQAFLNEIADGGRRHFYFFSSCKLDPAHGPDWTDRIAKLSTEAITLARYFISDPSQPTIRFEFEQEKEERQPYPDVPPPVELEDGSRIEYSAERVFTRAVLSYVDVNTKTGDAVAAIAQQERATDYSAIIAAFRVQMSFVTQLEWPEPRSLQNLAKNLGQNPNVLTSEEKRKTPSGSVLASSDNANASLSNDPVLQQVRAVTSGNNPFMRMRCAWLRAMHGSLAQDVTLWLNAWDNWLNLRQDATAADTRYVLDDVRKLL